MQADVYELLNSQINKEFQSAYIYLDFYNFFEERSLHGFSSWYKDQANEEIGHGWKFINFLHDLARPVTLTPIEHTSQKYASAKEVMEKGLGHEQYISQCIRKIYQLAEKEHDYETQSFLKYFIDEQVEEEVNARELLAKYKLVNEKGILSLDSLMAQSTAHEA